LNCPDPCKRGLDWAADVAKFKQPAMLLSSAMPGAPRRGVFVPGR
jgi:hypothetical protein